VISGDTMVISKSSEENMESLEKQHDVERPRQIDGDQVSNSTLADSTPQPAFQAVWWDEPEDRDLENPMNWAQPKKWMNILIVSAMTLIA
jgi:hypothetical protein